jgi:Flp pilus assembly protein TadD
MNVRMRAELQRNAIVMIPLKLFAVIAVLAVAGTYSWAGDVLRITIPRHSELTPVQRLNREGVDAVKNHQYERAATLFYKAYLYDPADPFTLNNLGYISELQGELERAKKFYTLASTQGSNASIDRSSAKELEGKPMQYAFQNLQDGPMRINWMNVDAMSLLSQNRNREAVALLRQAQSADPKNPFTLNNLGVAYEAIGEFDSALKAYDSAAAAHSSEPVVVTVNPNWRGRQVSAMAAASARLLDERMRKMSGGEQNAAMLTVRGVSAANENNWLAAKQDFLHAYSLDPSSAFSLNNRGYVAEMDGDLETAQFFYDKAREARDAGTRVGLATQRVAEGKTLVNVATESDHDVDGELDRYSRKRHEEDGPIELTPRSGSANVDGAAPSEMPSPSDVPPIEAPSVPQVQ